MTQGYRDALLEYLRLPEVEDDAAFYGHVSAITRNSSEVRRERMHDQRHSIGADVEAAKILSNLGLAP